MKAIRRVVQAVLGRRSVQVGQRRNYLIFQFATTRVNSSGNPRAGPFFEEHR